VFAFVTSNRGPLATFHINGLDAQTPELAPVGLGIQSKFGDLMNTLVQPRHARLGLIGRETKREALACL